MSSDVGANAATSRDIGSTDNNAAASYTPDLGIDGWTDTTLPVGDKAVYVDATGGSDSNDGLSTGAPKQTIAAGYALLADGSGDQLLLKCGETWTEGIAWNKSGRSTTERMVFGSYGSGDMPVVQATGSCWVPTVGLEHVILADLKFTATGAAVGVSNAVRMLYRSNDIVFEGCHFNLWQEAINAQGIYGGISGLTKHTNIVIRRCVVYDQHSTNAGHSSGLYFADIDGLTLTGVVLDSNGWLTSRDDATTDATVFNHNAYIQHDCENVTVEKTWSSNAAATAINFRPYTGEIVDSTSYKNPIGFAHGDANAPAQPSGAQRRNVTIDGANINSTKERGIASGADGVSSYVMEYCLHAHQVTGTAYGPSMGGVGLGDSGAAGNITWNKNIYYKWGGDLTFGSGVTNVDFSNCDIYQASVAPLYASPCIDTYDSNIGTSASNRYYTTESDGSRFSHEGSDVTDASWKSSWSDSGSTFTDLSAVYTDPEKDMDDYAVSIGLADADALLTQIRTQRKGNWDLNLTPDRINAYFRANFDMIPAPSSFTALQSVADVVCTWDEIPEADSYKVARDTDGGGYSVIGTPTAGTLTYTDTDPGAGTHTYKVLAVVDSTDGDYSDTAEVTISAPGDHIGNFGFWW